MTGKFAAVLTTFLFFNTPLFFSCASTPSTGAGSSALTGSFLITAPRPAALTIIGVSGPLQKREDEIAAAREDAARKVAMFHGIKASYETTHTTGSSIFGYKSESTLNLEYDEKLEQYSERLTFDPDRDLATNNRVVFIRFAYPVAFPGSIGYGFARNEDGRPLWTINPPVQINGFSAGVGFAARQWRRQDTFKKSYEAALAEIVTRLSANVSTRNTSDGNWNNTSTINIQGIVNLSNFLILEIWIDPKTQEVWTLAIARS